jgi:hypothetical protein
MSGVLSFPSWWIKILAYRGGRIEQELGLGWQNSELLRGKKLSIACSIRTQHQQTEKVA